MPSVSELARRDEEALEDSILTADDYLLRATRVEAVRRVEYDNALKAWQLANSRKLDALEAWVMEKNNGR